MYFTFFIFKLYICILILILTLQVPKEWKLDSKWEREARQPEQLSHRRSFPSKWKAAASHQDPVHTVKIVDQFVIRKERANADFEVANGSEIH